MGLTSLSVSGRQLTIALCTVLALGAAIAAGGQSTQRRMVQAVSVCALDELSGLAGLLGSDGKPLAPERLGVEVVQEGGPLFVQPAVVEAVSASRSFTSKPSRHLVRVEALGAGDSLVLRYRLWRKGWDVRAAMPSWSVTAPWLAVLAGLLGAAVAFHWRRVVIGIAVAGVSAQVLVALVTWPADPALRPGLWARIKTGPGLCHLDLLAQRLPQLGSMGLAALAAFCLTLVWFDHRRSRSTATDIGLMTAVVTSLLGVAGLSAWLEAGARSGFIVSLGTLAGLLGLAGLIGAWIPAMAAARDHWRGD